MPSLAWLEKEIRSIKARNERVEADKAWETSFVRRGLLFVFTYLAVSLYLNAVQIPDPWLNAIVPAVGFLLSTLTLPFFKKKWVKHLYKK
ncbi:hypothetical protein KKE06_05770 [Candidatus Micrarchaeota archaeon]|nr:hypothetical protein [Candidatus Micrarchaeota archaeon]MBU1931001.1 hypothetical protein [Candidatus Micrarchaeota archaeon]